MISYFHTFLYNSLIQIKLWCYTIICYTSYITCVPHLLIYSFPMLIVYQMSNNTAQKIDTCQKHVNSVLLSFPCCCLHTPLTLVWGGGLSPIIPFLVHRQAYPSIWPAASSLQRGLSLNPGVTMRYVCGCS